MFSSVVVGVDESGGGCDAVALASDLLGSTGTVTLVHVLPRNPYDSHEAAQAYRASELLGSFDDFVHSRALALLEQMREQVWPHPGALEFDARTVVSSSVGRCLHEAVQDTSADLLVVGSSQRTLLGRVLIGDETRAALNGAPCAVAIAPAGYADRSAPIAAVGVGYDGSPESEYALAVGRELAAQSRAKLSAAAAISVPVSSFGPGPLPLRDAVDALVTQARARIVGLGGCEAEVGYGAPVDVLAHFSESVDLLVIGSRGFGPVGRLVHGSTSRRLMRSARCALLVLPRAAALPAIPDTPAGKAELVGMGQP
jgi:nucleotide-binding universal stress UspA family protein